MASQWRWDYLKLCLWMECKWKLHGRVSRKGQGIPEIRACCPRQELTMCPVPQSLPGRKPHRVGWVLTHVWREITNIISLHMFCNFPLYVCKNQLYIKGLQCVCRGVHCMNQGACHLRWQISRRTFQYESAFQALENPHYSNILLCVPTHSHTPNASNCGCYNKIMAAMCSSTGNEILTFSRVV